MRVESLHIYPVKATAPIQLAAAEVEPWGLAGDRRWAVIDADGHRLNSPKHAQLLQITATPHEDGSLTLSAVDLGQLHVPVPYDGPLVEVGISRLAQAVDAGVEAAGWFSKALQQEVRLIWQDDPRRRPISVEHGGSGDEPLSLADTAPLLLTTTSSMDQLNAWIAEGPIPEPLPIQRFRPNVVIDGYLEPFIEDTWRVIRIGDVDYRFTEHCDRCATTTIDRDTLARSKEPIRTLAQHRKWNGSTWFGVRVAPLTTGRIAVGDSITVLDSAEANGRS